MQTYHPLMAKHCSIQNQYPKAMVPDTASAGIMEIVHGGESSSRSINITTDGVAWRLISRVMLKQVVMGCSDLTYRHEEE
jgi:hypothetical protein